VEVEIRQAALCLIRHEDAFLVAEIQDPHSGVVLHRPPGGGIEEGDSPEQAPAANCRKNSASRWRPFVNSAPSIMYGSGKVERCANVPGSSWQAHPTMRV